MRNSFAPGRKGAKNPLRLSAIARKFGLFDPLMNPVNNCLD
jgi:hypothetical protein